MDSLICRLCKVPRTLNQFYRTSKHDPKPQHPCKPCRKSTFKETYWSRSEAEIKHDRAMKKQWRDNNKEWCAVRHMLYDYKISIDQYAALEESQDWSCAICKTSEDETKLHLDHNHHTGKVRGFLCSGCNMGLGNFADNIEYLKAAIVYLEKKGSYADHYTEQRNGHRFRGVRIPDREEHVHGEYY